MLMPAPHFVAEPLPWVLHHRGDSPPNDASLRAGIGPGEVLAGFGT